MKNKKISEMTKNELIAFSKNRLNDIADMLQIYNQYYDDKCRICDLELNENKDTIKELQQCAYFINDIFERIEWSYKKQIIIDSIEADKLANIKPKRGEIWTCQLGKNIGSEENKIRPVVIIQNNTGNEISPTTIVVPISKKPKKIAVHIELRDSDYVLVEGESKEITGTILCEQIKVISKARLGRHIATLKNEFVNKILNIKLKNSIALTN